MSCSTNILVGRPKNLSPIDKSPMLLIFENFAVFSSFYDILENMDEFFIDRHGEGNENKEKVVTEWTDNEDEDEETNIIDGLDELPDGLEEDKKQKKNLSNDFNLNETYLIGSYINEMQKNILPCNISKIMHKSLKHGLEQQHAVINKNSKLLKLERKKLKQKTKGQKWFNLPATEVTQEIKNDFQVLKMRGVLDRKHVYKKNDITKMPKYFQVGTVLESPADFYTGRIVKSQRKKTLVDELLADAECRNYQKKKFKEIMFRKKFRR